MPKTNTSKLTRFVSGLAVLGLVLQSIFPIFNLEVVPRAFAASNTWDFSTAGDYTVSSNATISGTGGYVVTDLEFTASSDNLDAHGPTQDLVQTSTGRVIAAVGTNSLPRSDDNGSNWALSGGATAAISATDLKISGSNIVAAGANAGAPAIAYSSDDGDSWTIAFGIYPNNTSSVNDISTTVGGSVYAVTSNTAGNGDLMVSDNNGALWTAAAAKPGATALNTVEIAGSRIFVGGSGWAYDGTTDETGIFYTDDGGANWTQAFTTSVGSTHTSVAGMAYDSTAGVLYAITNAGYILKSSTTPGTGTPTFTRVTATNADLATDIYISKLSGVSSNFGDIFVTLTNGSMLRSVNGGVNFFTASTALSGIYANKIIRIDTDASGEPDDNYLLAIRNDGSNGDAYRGAFATGESVANDTGVAYSTISAFTETMSDLSETHGLKYRISHNGSSWYYWNGSAWTASSNMTTHVSSASVINTNIASFDDQVGTGTFYFQAAFVDGGLSSPESAVNASSIVDSVAITYVAASITVISPNGPPPAGDPADQTPWYISSNHNITWSSVGLGAGDIITLSYSLDDGDSWYVIDGTDTSPTTNDGSYAWTLPSTTSDLALVKVANGSTEDVSDAAFQIVEFGGGEPCDSDTVFPLSEVNDLPPSIGTVPFTVRVTASDNCILTGVNLYYTYESPVADPDQLIQFGTTHHGCPLECFAWEFNAPFGDGLYRFYSSAVDLNGNDNWETKFADGPSGGYYYRVEAWTRADRVGPYPVVTTPTQNQADAPVSGEVYFEFNERTQPDSFEYNFYKLVNGLPVLALDKLGDPEWLPSQEFEQCPPDSQAICSVDPNGTTIYDKRVRISYLELDHDTVYYFNIRHLLDKAGNDVQTNWPEPPDNNLVWSLRFTTGPEIHPDLRPSSIEITNLPVGGKFDPGNKVSFRVNLINIDDTPALATITIPIAEGLTYCSVSPCSPPAASGGSQPLVIVDGSDVSITWTGNVIKGSPVAITFDTRVNNPSLLLAINQTVTIDDGVHADFGRSVTVNINEHANYSQSIKIGMCDWRDVFQPCTDAVAGTPITYTITIKNTGSTPGRAMVTDSLGTFLDYMAGPTGVDSVACPSGSSWESLAYDPVADSINGQATIAPGGDCRIFTFTAAFTAASDDRTVTNTAIINGLPGGPSFSTFVPGISEPEEFSPKIVLEVPEDQTSGVALTSNIEVAFSKSIDIATFAYTVTIQEEELDTSDWEVTWEEYNGNPNAHAIIARPDGQELDLGAEYTVTIADEVTDIHGNTLQASVLPNPWSFTTIDPIVVITQPTEPVVKIGLDEVSPAFLVEVKDQNSGVAYVLPEPVQIGLLAEVPATGKPGTKRQISQTARFSTAPNGIFLPSSEDDIYHINIPAGSNQASFYFKESVENLDNIIAFPDPWNGWSAGQKAVLVSGQEDNLTNRLDVEMSSSSMGVAEFSKPMHVGAISDKGTPLLIPETLYFYTESTTGRFYDSKFQELPDYITIQGMNSTNNLQYASGLGGVSATFYYIDFEPQSSLVTISDNAPLNPDTSLANANLILTIQSTDPEDILQELEEVIDDSGRVLDQVIIDPTKAVLLPGGIKSFAVKALDTDGNEIENAKFKWYVTAGGGKIEKDGIDDNSHTSIFTAGDDLGNFYDTIIVATLYNGKFGFATASIRVSDIVEYDGPPRLPMTGIAGIQLIFMAMTLLAAVALAWVEHYDKTHFSKDN